jgi:TnpA family transposase
LAKVNSHSTKNRIALALKELGNAVRTTYSLEWTMDESLCRTVHKGTTKIERHHNIAKHLPSILAVTFGQTTLQIKKKLLFTTNL